MEVSATGLHHRPYDPGFPGGSVVKNPPAVQETGSNPESVRSPEKEMAPHSSTLAWESPRTEEPGGLQSMGSKRVEHDAATKQQLSHDPAISLPGVDPEETKSASQTNVYAPCSLQRYSR